MALLSMRLMALRLLGRLPKTNAYEAADKALRQEFDEFNRFVESEELKHFMNLKEFVDSGEPGRVKEELRALKYQNSDEFVKEQEYKEMLKNKAFKNYLKVEDSEKLNAYRSVELSGKPFRFQELKGMVESSQYKAERKNHKKENSDEYQREIEYKMLKNDKEVKMYFKLKRWAPLLDYLEVEKSDMPEKFQELEQLVNSADFTQKKQYLQSSDKSKYLNSEAHQKLTEYKQLLKSDRIKWYFKLKDTSKFDDIKRWELTFSDSFNQGELDRKKWITRYFWGEALMNKSYSLAADRHWYTDGDNISFEQDTLKITTKKEPAEGLAWDHKYGFIPKKFSYTSGIISTGNFFRQQGGRFEAKIRLSGTSGVYHAFWLVGDSMLPEVDVLRQNSKSSALFQGAYFWQNGEGKAKEARTRIRGIDLGTDFFILSLDWLTDRMVWKLNGIPYMEQTENLPQKPTYIVISSGVTADAPESNLPASLEVDWVKCWKEVGQ